MNDKTAIKIRENHGALAFIQCDIEADRCFEMDVNKPGATVSFDRVRFNASKPTGGEVEHKDRSPRASESVLKNSTALASLANITMDVFGKVRG